MGFLSRLYKGKMCLIKPERLNLWGSVKHKEFPDSLRREEIEGGRSSKPLLLDASVWYTQLRLALFTK